ncbi:MAG: hypothetical protein GX575_32010 [Candidatus Anammoximicrobium sp.]|nr:hypothetical protein [Candidatus Anammoximicrobium sp.]
MAGPRDENLLATAMARRSDEASQDRVPDRIRLQRYERELDDRLGELAA